MKTRHPIACSVFTLIPLLIHGSWAQAASLQQDTVSGPFVSKAVAPVSSVELKKLPLSRDGNTGTQKNSRPRQNPLLNQADQSWRKTWNSSDNSIDPLIQRILSREPSPPPLLSFDGTGNPVACGGCTPPDPVGDVGPSHYVQMVNSTKVAVYNKSGILLSGPFDLSTLWPTSAASTCDNPDFGDPIALYDPMAKRWLLSQFADKNHMCIAISKTPDPTGAYWLYEFDVGSFPDYFKFGVWPDAYYMSANETTYTAYAFDRQKMLNGQTATFQKFTGGTNLYLPSDLDGARQPPAGSPNYFYTFKDNSFHGGSDRIEVYAFHVDWATPANSTFALQKSINIAPFTYTPCGFFNLDCIAQLGTSQRFDAVSEWPMFRFPYRNFGAYQALAGTFTIGGGLGEAGAASRWFELRKTDGDWTLYQQGTVDPGDGNDRVMSSIAMDGLGNIALGYTVSSSTMRPTIAYSVRRVSDAPGTMHSEAIMTAGGGSQTGSNRWGDYSAMTVDPADDLSFWYTNEYYSANSLDQWQTRIGKFQVAKTGTLIKRSVGANDGWVLESSENSNQGGSLDAAATVLNVGDDALNRQYRAILHFDTSELPDNAVVTKAILKIRKQGITGSVPNNLQNISIDIRNGGFANNAALQNRDFQAAANVYTAGTIINTPDTDYSAGLKGSALPFVNLTGPTQLRLRFEVDDNNNLTPDILSFFSGNAVKVGNRPQLIISYYVP